MKKLITIILVAIAFGNTAFAADNDSKAGSDSTARERYYEGSVSFIYSYLISPGIYTTLESDRQRETLHRRVGIPIGRSVRWIFHQSSFHLQTVLH